MTTTVQLAPTIQESDITFSIVVEISAEQLLSQIKVHNFKGPIYFGIFKTVGDFFPSQFYLVSEWFIINRVNPTVNIKQDFGKSFYAGKYYIRRSN